MGRLTDISQEQQVRIDRELDAFFAFTEDVFADPSILDHIPNDADVQAVRIAERDPERQYDVETPSTVAIVTPPGRKQRTPTRQRPTMPSPPASRWATRTRGQVSRRGRTAQPPLPVKGSRQANTG